MKSIIPRRRPARAATAWMAAAIIVLSSSSMRSSSVGGGKMVVVESFAPPDPARIVPTASRRNVDPRRRGVVVISSSSFDVDGIYDHPDGGNDDDAPNAPTAAAGTTTPMIIRRFRPLAFAFLTSTASLLLPNVVVGRRIGIPIPPVGVPSASAASTPIVLRAAQKKEDPPMVQASKKAEELRKKKSLEEFDAFMERANDIEVSEGKAARDAYEKEYHIEKARAEVIKRREIIKLRRELLDEGMDPNTDLDAERQVYLLEHGIDLEKVSGTPHNERMIKNFQRRGKRGKGGSSIADMEHQRYIVKCQVADLKARGIDPMEHFADVDVMQKTRAIYRMEDDVAMRVAKQYEKLMEEYGGRLTPRKEGEGPPFVYPDIDYVVDSAAKSASDGGGDDGGETRADARARRAAERAAIRSEKSESKTRAKAERSEARERVRAKKVAAREAAKMKTADSTTMNGPAILNGAGGVGGSSIASAATTVIAEDGITDDGVAMLTESGDGSIIVRRDEPSATADIISTIRSRATATNVGAVVVVGGAAAYGLNYYRENNSASKSERERQLRLILGNEIDDDDDDDDEDDDEDDDDDDDLELFTSKKAEETKQQQSQLKSDEKPRTSPVASPPPAASTTQTPPATKPKRTLGIFSRRNADARPTDLNTLIGPNAQAPELAALLAQILTFGAPGRFPKVTSWKRPMPFVTYDAEAAKAMLTESRADADLTEEQSAEIFASVVNCMIIDIVDLASSTLKAGKKDDNEKVTVDAINVVMDFMDHAASLFDAVSKDITIKPVTYGGSLRKKDLEQMFSIYAGSSMLSLAGSGSGQDRVDTLQLVFGITDKKAEGLMQKHMMKMVMNLMKDGGKGLEGMEGMEGMEEMMKAMGGGGMPGMPGMDGELNPEDLKQTLGMMRDLMESGQVSKEELGEVRKQFREMYGSDISELIKKASEEGAAEEMSDDERELLDLFKQILGDE